MNKNEKETGETLTHKKKGEEKKEVDTHTLNGMTQFSRSFCVIYVFRDANRVSVSVYARYAARTTMQSIAIITEKSGSL